MTIFLVIMKKRPRIRDFGKEDNIPTDLFDTGLTINDRKIYIELLRDHKQQYDLDALLSMLYKRFPRRNLGDITNEYDE